MNDPHVVSLRYRVVTGPHVDFDMAAPVEFETPDFRVAIAEGAATFAMAGHFASVEEARRIVDPFVQAWEISSCIENDPGDFTLEYDRAEVIDRAPTPGVVCVTGVQAVATFGMDAVAHVKRGRFPTPPLDFVCDEVVEAMAWQYEGVRQRRLALGAVSYFCLSLLEGAFGGRDGIRDRLSISSTVLTTFGRLSSEKGGKARKGLGLGSEFTNQERAWLKAVIKLFIRRAGEYGFEPTKVRPLVTMADLPDLN